MMSRPHPVARTALVYAGAQKNLGPAGVVLAIVRKDLYARIPKSVPKIFSFQARRGEELPQHAADLRHLHPARDLPLDGGQGGLAAIEKRNTEKAALIYDAIDGSGGFYKGTVTDKARAAT